MACKPFKAVVSICFHALLVRYQFMFAVLFQPKVLYQFDEIKVSRLMDFGLSGKEENK